MLHYLTRGQPLAAEVLEQVIARTDGVPLFLEEFVKMLQESRLPQEPTNHHERTTPRLPLAIPATLQDALMARLDHLGSTRELALLGATWGREFTYGQLQSLVAMEEVTLQQQLTRLVEAEILYQRGLPPLASYRFKHALIQETAYQSLLRSTRQAYHQRIAQAITEHFPETAETEPELLAHHYTEAGHHAQAIPYWQRAGERALARSANLEAISHLTRGLEVLTTLPDTPERISQELHLQMSLGSVLFSTKGFAAPEVEHAYSRARELCQQVGDTSALFPVLRGLSVWYMNRAQLQPARELAEERLYLAQRQQDPTLILMARATLGTILYHAGEFASALVHIEQSLALPAEGEREYPVGLQYNAVGCLSHVAWALWFLGYADQSRARSQEALELALQLGMPFRLANVFYWATQLHQYRRDSSRTRELAEATLALSTEQGFAQQIGQGRFLRGWALAMQGQAAAGLAQMREGFAAWEATEAEVLRPYYLALLAEVSAYAGETQAGLDLLDAALVAVDKSEERSWEAEVYRLKGELLLQQAGGTGNTLAVTEAAVTCFHQAMTIARRQEAKALELRAAMSLARCCRQEQRAQARALLAEVYNWFTEGFDTVDMQEARALLAALG
jgi:predicted ATPase